MNGQFSQFFVTASSVRQPLNYSKPFSLLLYCMESRGCSESLAWDLQLPKEKKKTGKIVRDNQASESQTPAAVVSAGSGLSHTWLFLHPCLILVFAVSVPIRAAGRCELLLAAQPSRELS